MGKKKGQTTRGEKERALVRSMQALDYRCAGMSFAEIANELGVSRSTAFNYVQRILGTRVKENERRIAELRELENARLDAIWVKVFGNIQNAKPDKDGVVAMDDNFIRAVNACLRISTRRSRINGFETAQKLPDGAQSNPMPEDFHQVVGVLALLARKHPDAFDAFVEVSTVPPESQ